MAWLIDSVRRNFGLKAGAVAIAVVLWFTFNYSSVAHLGYTKTVDVPLAMRGVGADLVTESDARLATIELSGPRADVDAVNAGNLSAFVDCSGKVPGVYSLAVNVIGQGADIVKKVTPAQAIVTVDRYAYRTVPVLARDSVGGPLTNAQIEPPLIQVAGGASVVAAVYAAEISVPEPHALPAGFSAEMTPVAVDKRLSPVTDVTAIGVVRITAMPVSGSSPNP